MVADVSVFARIPSRMRVARVLALLASVVFVVPASRATANAQTALTPLESAKQPPLPASGGIRIGSVLSPDTVQVGDRFILTITVELPAGASIEWPTPADSNGPVSMRAPVRVTGTENAGLRRETAEYDMAVWSVGAVKVALPDIKYKNGAVESTIPFEAPSLFVQSVLPGDTSLHQPKPAKDLFPRIVPWWERWWPALAILAALLLIGLLVWRAKHKRLRNAPLDPFARAERDFDRLDRLAFHEAGEQGRFVALAIEVLRVYMSVRLPAATLALTSDELLQTVQPDSRVPTQRLAPLLAEGDSIKFGRRAIDGAHAKHLATEARGVVSAIEQAEQARRAAEKAQEKTRKKDKKREEAEARLEAEEKARVDSVRGKSEAA